jgi:hypothetical protein
MCVVGINIAVMCTIGVSAAALRIRIIQKPPVTRIDGIQLDRFMPGSQYEVGSRLGSLFLAEGWAEPVQSDEPALAIPVSELETKHDPAAPRNLVREICPPYYDGPSALAADRRRAARRRARTPRG